MAAAAFPGAPTATVRISTTAPGVSSYVVSSPPEHAATDDESTTPSTHAASQEARRLCRK